MGGDPFDPDDDLDEDFDVFDDGEQAMSGPAGPGYDLPLLSPVARQRAEALRERLGQPEAALRDLSGEALILLRLLAEIGRLAPLPFVAEEGRLLLEAEPCARAFDELSQKELLLSERYYGAEHVGLPRECARRLLPLLPPLWEPAPGPGVQAEVPSALRQLPFELALLTVALWTVRPRRTASGPLYKRDEERLQGLLGAGFPLGERLRQLKEMGLCGGEDVLTVSPGQAEFLGQLSYAQITLAQAAQLFSGARQAVLQLLLFAAAGPQRGWVALPDLLRAMRVGYLQGPCYFQRHATLAKSAESELERLLSCTALEVVRQPGRTLVRLHAALRPGEAAPDTPAPGQGPGKIHLQPSFELLVPPDAPARGLLQLGRVAELEKVDQVVCLRLSRGAVCRAAEGGLSEEDILGILQQHALRGVPQNVAAQVRGWVGQAGQARFAQGLVLVLSSEADRLVQLDAALQRLLGRRVGPGVYLLSEGDRAAVDKRLRALDLPAAEGVLRLGSEAGGGAPGRPFAPPEPLPAAMSGPLWERAAAVRAPGSPSSRSPRPAGRPALKLVPSEPPVEEKAAPRPEAAESAGAAEAAWQRPAPEELERLLRRAIADKRLVQLRLSGEAEPWSVLPQRLSRRGARQYVEAFRPSVNQYRIIPLDLISGIAAEGPGAPPGPRAS